MNKADELKELADEFQQLCPPPADMVLCELKRSQLRAAIGAQQAEILSLMAAVADLLSGWRYIRQSHGDLYGVAWDRAEKRAIIALGAQPDVSYLELGAIINNALLQAS